VTEADGGGTDLVRSAVSFSLDGSQFENLSLTGSAGTDGTGNGFANTIIGNAGNNVLNGGSGADKLKGGDGSDSFAFTTSLVAGNIDTITDFSVAADTIRLSRAVFDHIAGTGTLSAAQFVANASGVAQDANDRIIYETDTGKLFYDSNGSSAGGSVQFAALSRGLALTNADFSIV
jgi:Ca2+-binding RTX toxin-like protein